MMTRYGQAHTRRVAGLPLDTISDAYDLCAEVGTESIGMMQEHYTREDYLAIVRPDELRFASVRDSLACATRESVIYNSSLSAASS